MPIDPALIKRIRNFSIIAHIDHGKSTLADRLLETTGTIPERMMRAQVLDKMDLERERGITIKAKAVRMIYSQYILNLIDTPGHVDFSYEVSRALAACEGALLVVDASQGVEAQTLANAHLASEMKLTLIPVINKTDLPQADVEGVSRQLQEILHITRPPVLASAKEGKGIAEILRALVEAVPSPQGDSEAPLSALIFDSFYDVYRGVVLYVRVFQGTLRPQTKIRLFSSKESFLVEELGHLTPGQKPAESLQAGEVGYVIAGIKDTRQIRIGDTMTELARPAPQPLPGYREVKPVVFAGFFPINSADYQALQKALEKLNLSDSSFQYQVESSQALGFGFRLGFLGLLHMEIIKERLEREFDLSLIATTPNVIYHLETRDGQILEVDNPAKFPPYGEVLEIQEPYVKATIILPVSYLDPVMNLLKEKRGEYVSIEHLNNQRVIIQYELPLSEMILDFYDRLKSVSKGYASFDYESPSYRTSDLVKLEILIHQDVVDALSLIVHKDKAYYSGRALAEKLKELIPRQMFEVAIQAKVGGKIVARETVPAVRKDVLAKCYGGDITRKRKLLQKQKEGKKKLKQLGSVEIPQEAFLAALKIGK